MKKIKIALIIIGLFLFFLCWNVIVQPLNLDEIWNYGFSYAIAKGEVPYLDFNMVITPFYPFLMAIFLAIFGKNIIVYHIVNSAMLTAISFLAYRLIKEKSFLLLLGLCFPVSLLFPSYNLFLLMLFILLIYLEKEGKNDYLIGLTISFLFLTKQSVGVFFVIPSILYWKKWNKLGKRAVGFLLPVMIFGVYLLATGSFKQFWDFCFLGLFDFAGGNGQVFTLIFLLCMAFLVFTILLIKKDSKNILNYYLLAFWAIAVPLFDLYHFMMYVVAFFIILFMQKDIKLPIRIPLFVSGVVIGVGIIILTNRITDTITFPNNINNFNYRLIDKRQINYTNDMLKAIEKYGYNNVIFMSADGYYFKIIGNQKIGYLDLINTGNFGFGGSKKLRELIKKNSSKVFFVDQSEVGSNKQTDQNALKYVIDNGKLIESIWKYDVYTLEDLV